MGNAMTKEEEHTELIRDVASLQQEIKEYERRVSKIESEISSVKILLSRFLLVISVLGMANFLGKAGILSLLELVK